MFIRDALIFVERANVYSVKILKLLLLLNQHCIHNEFNDY